MRNPRTRFAALCAIGAALSASCSAYNGLVVRTYPGPDRGRNEVALLVYDLFQNLRISHLDSHLLDFGEKPTFPYRIDSKAELKDVAPGQHEIAYIFELEPGAHMIVVELFVFKAELARSLPMELPPVTLRFRAEEGRVYRLFTTTITTRGGKELRPGISDVTGGGYRLVSETIY